MTKSSNGKNQAAIKQIVASGPLTMPVISKAQAIAPIHQDFSIRPQSMNLRRALVYLSCFLCLATFGLSQATPVVLMPVPQFQALDASGRTLAFGCVFTYQSGSNTPLVTYTDATGSIENEFPVPLSASGAANVWLKAGQAYTIKVTSAGGGVGCPLGTTIYTVDGIGGGGNTLTTIVSASGGSATFTIQAQNQLFQILLTQNVVSAPLSAVGVIPPGLVTWEITQDSVGGRSFAWPSNSIGGCTIASAANAVTVQHFVWDGVNAYALGPCTVGNGPTVSLGDILDYGLAASSLVCTDTNKKLVTACSALVGVTYNGQAVALGASGNVNAGAAAHSVALNQAANNPLTGLTLTNDQLVKGVTGADPVAVSVPNCTAGLTYDTTAHTFGCIASGITILASATISTCNLAANGGEWNCSATASWGSTLPSSTYKVMCTLSNPMPAGSYPVPSGFQTNYFIGTKTTTTFVYTLNDDHSGSDGAGFKMDCIATQ